MADGGARALRQPTALTVPFTEEALIDPARPVSLGYAMTLKRGQKLDVEVTVVTDLPGQVFVDLFERYGLRVSPDPGFAPPPAASSRSSEHAICIWRGRPDNGAA